MQTQPAKAQTANGQIEQKQWKIRRSALNNKYEGKNREE